jgi:serine/threonine-protein kinase HipA
MRELAVSINDRLVGHLREDNDLWQFGYAPEWSASSEGFDLSPALPRSEGRIADGATTRPVQWYFDNLLPEEALRSIVAREARLAAEDAFGLLAWFGAESAGSLVLRDPLSTVVAEHGLKPLPLAELSRRITGLPRASLTRDAPKRMSLAGAQHKMLVVLQGEDLYEPLPATPSTHILKPDHQGDDYPSSVVNEYFTMRLASGLGLDVPEVTRLYVPQPVYVVQRFDRIAGTGTHEATRRHIIDTCQLLNTARTFKYSAANPATLSRAIHHCKARAAARLHLYRWLVFSVLVGNGDNHLKNISFTVGPAGIEVAPAYDLLCTAAYDTRAMSDHRARWPDTQLAFALDGAARFSDVRAQHIVAAGRQLGLAEATAKRELDRMCRTIAPAADALIAEIEAENPARAASSPDPLVTQTCMAGELRLLRAMRHVVIADMIRQVTAAE